MLKSLQHGAHPWCESRVNLDLHCALLPLYGIKTHTLIVCFIDWDVPALCCMYFSTKLLNDDLSPASWPTHTLVFGIKSLALTSSCTERMSRTHHLRNLTSGIIEGRFVVIVSYRARYNVWLLQCLTATMFHGYNVWRLQCLTAIKFDGYKVWRQQCLTAPKMKMCYLH